MSNIDLTKSEQYTLSIRLSADGFSFSVYHPQKTEDFFHASYTVNPSYSMTANIKKMFASMNELSQPYQQVNILIDTERFTTVPFDLFEDELTEELFHQNFLKDDNETILCNILGKSNVALLFGMDRHAHQALIEHFGQVRIFACVSPLTELFTSKSQEGNCRKLFAHFLPDKMEVFAFDRNKLLLINSFKCHIVADQVYYLLFIWQQLGFSQEKDQIYLSGGTNIGKDLPTELSKFLRQVTLLPTENNLPFDLQTLMTCE